MPMQLEPHGLKYLYKYRSVAGAELILKNRTVRCSHPSVFNDLLDGQVDLRIPSGSGFKEKLIQEYLRLVYESTASVIPGTVGSQLVNSHRALARITKSRSEVERCLREAVSAITDDTSALATQAGDLVRVTTAAANILCLSADPGSMPMWYHYADKYRGVVIAFDCQSDPNSLFSLAKKVSYATAIPHLCSDEEWVRVCTGQQERPSVLEALYFTKSDQWAYEQEWRLLAAKGGPGSYKDLPLVADELGGIVLGLNTPDADATRLVELARAWRPSCVVWKAKLNYSRYGFDIEQVP